MSETPEALEHTLRDIYNRIAPQLKIDGLNVRVNIEANDFGFGYVTGIEVTSIERRFSVELSLQNDYGDEDISEYLWVYEDLHSGFAIESELNYTASPEEVTAFVEHRLALDTYWQKG